MSWCARVSEMPHERPCVILMLRPPLGKDIADRIGTGCEEENIPLAWDTAQDAGETAHTVALRSRLEVGILASEGHVSIGVVQFPESPWMDVEIKRPEDWRWIGQVAARLVKGQPIPARPDDAKKIKEPEKPATPVTRTPPQSPLPAPDAGLCDVSAPYLKELDERAKAEADNFEAVVSLVTREILERLRGKGE